MQLITFLSAATAMIATASAGGAVTLNQDCNTNEAYARVINRCSYPVYLWSVYKGDGCPTGEMVTLKTGEVYNENLQDPKGGSTGVSIKLSKEQQCKSDIVQLEYFLQKEQTGFNYNYLDVSYVDCTGGDCPTKSEGYYLVSGNQTGSYSASAGNTWCPILSCNDAASCAKCSYINPDDVQTKTCDLTQNLDFYMCGGHAPTEEYGSSPAPAASSSKKAAASSAPAPSSAQDNYKVKAAAVTPAPEASEEKHGQKTKTHVEVVYVTAVEYVNAKRHAHGHARRHQPFHA